MWEKEHIPLCHREWDLAASGSGGWHDFEGSGEQGAFGNGSAGDDGIDDDDSDSDGNVGVCDSDGDVGDGDADKGDSKGILVMVKLVMMVLVMG